MARALRHLGVLMLVGGGLMEPPARSWAQCLPAPACRPGNAPVSALNSTFGFRRLTLANVDTTLRSDAGAGYLDLSCRTSARLDRGRTYSLRVQVRGRQNLGAWLDLNQDGRFDPVTEVLPLTGTDSLFTAPLTLPASLPPGATLRLRLAADYANSPLPGPCTTPQYGQSLDLRLVTTAAAAPPPQAAFTVRDSVLCGAGAATQFLDRSRNVPTSWRWRFGDGGTSTQPQPTHTYAAPGNYTVSLRVCNARGCDSVSRLAFVTVRADGPHPAPCQPATQAYCCGFGLLRVQLGALDHQPGGGAAGYQDASCAQRATLRADWTDTLRLTTSPQAAHDVRIYLDLNDDGQLDPTAELLYQGRGVSSPIIPLRLSALTAGLVFNKALRLRLWTDYAGSPGRGPCAAPERGQVVDYTVLVLPNNVAPRAAFQLRYEQPCGPVRVSLNNTSLGSSTYRWDFGDGTSSTAAVPPPHTYTVPGAYTIKLVAGNAAGVDSVQRQTAVAGACPRYCESEGFGGNDYVPSYFTRVQLGDVDNRTVRQARVGYRDFTGYVATARQGERVALRLEYPPSPLGDPGPWYRTVVWIDFNQDGYMGPSEQVALASAFSPFQTSFVIPPTARLGATRVRCKIYVLSQSAFLNSCSARNASLSATEDYTLMILPAPSAPRGGFTVDLPRSCSGQVQLRDTSWFSPTAWQWDFGDGSTSTAPNPLHTYAQPGRYAIIQQVRNAYGVSATTPPQYVTVTDLGRGPRPAATALSTGPLCCSLGMEAAQLASLTYTGGVNLPGYEDETCSYPAASLTAGATYPFSVTSTAQPVDYIPYLWLDANDDGLFDPSEQLFGLSIATPQTVTTGTFTVPPTAVRNRSLRLRLYWRGFQATDYHTVWPAPDPQNREEGYSQVRDFTVVVRGGPALAAAAASPTPGGWTLAPNPASSTVTLRGLTVPQEVVLYNCLGQVVLRQRVAPDARLTSQLSVLGLPAGLYVVQAQQQSRRLVVQ